MTAKGDGYKNILNIDPVNELLKEWEKRLLEARRLEPALMAAFTQ
jgi:hypothetical protein